MALTADGSTPPPFADDAAATELIERFRDLTLPKAHWTHASHLLVGLWYLDCHDLARARVLVPAAIRRYNAAVGTVDTTRGGYHETITQFYLGLIDRFRREWVGETSLAVRANALYRCYGDRRLIYRHYTEERLWSAEARVRWVEPDLTPEG